ncbi:MAG: hypothetical protein M1838_002026 [Thelocarpon superellum]|nr:MAG: hypothetical protein M1838_002026 [Thelocarpon superellum]
MAALRIDTSHAKRSDRSARFSIHEGQEDGLDAECRILNASKGIQALKLAGGDTAPPLTTSKRSNQSGLSGAISIAVHKVQKSERASDGENGGTHQPMDKLLAQLVEQQVLLKKQQHALATVEPHDHAHLKDHDSSSDDSVPITPATDVFDITPPRESEQTDDDRAQREVNELRRLKEELQAAKDKIARMDQELSQTRITKHTLDQALGSATELDFNGTDEVTERTISTLQHALNASTRPAYQVRESKTLLDDAFSDSSDALSPGSFPQAPGIWGNPAKPALTMALTTPVDQQAHPSLAPWEKDPARSWGHRGVGPTFSSASRPLLGTHSQAVGDMARPMADMHPFVTNSASRYPGMPPPRSGASYGQRSPGWTPFAPAPGATEPMKVPTNAFLGPSMYSSSMGYQPRPIGTPLSPTAAEFTATHAVPSPWNNSAPSSPGQTYVSPIEPLNYRRLLDRTVNCNWKYIVDKIVCNNDQQASIFLQQKLKIGTAEQKYEIVEAIVSQAYPLMVNRFGNFLVQRCFEHGTADQVIAIANAIRGNTLNLSMDAFGCHVVQKAFDSVPEEYKAVMVRELLRRIPETVIHRYACHVWQKLFELRWNDSPPQIMKYVNDALRGMWHEVALGETGSLVVQNIFENCLEDDKRPCINEVLASIDMVAHGQFGNWCIQHICEHGAPMDRGRAIDHVIRFATEYSMDQFASKVVEKCLKIGGPEFLERYLDRVCEAQSDRPRIPLIDIASDQYGNYLVQYILTHSNPQHRELVATHIRKHMVSLRGSKFGSRVGMLCCNPAFSTRPGPGAGPPVGRFGTPRYGGSFR